MTAMPSQISCCKFFASFYLIIMYTANFFCVSLLYHEQAKLVEKSSGGLIIRRVFVDRIALF